MVGLMFCPCRRTRRGRAVSATSGRTARAAFRFARDPGRAPPGLRLSIGKVKAGAIEAAARQAHALRRAWDLGTLDLCDAGADNPRVDEVTDVSALVGCTTLHTLKLEFCLKVTDVSRWRAAQHYTRSLLRTARNWRTFRWQAAQRCARSNSGAAREWRTSCWRAVPHCKYCGLKMPRH
mmetsp:Transcript_29575/g.88962  ORF Transcript_29575/g.88962 Transcript_29575/m.88962 type:complete len:179 (+) Transcript_29575:125-661(+)